MKNSIQVVDVFDYQNYYEHTYGGLNKIFLTSGCKNVADYANAHWFFDIILSYQTNRKLKGEVFQIWELNRQSNETWVVTCMDGSLNLLASREIDYCNFPNIKNKFFLVDGVCMLETES